MGAPKQSGVVQLSSPGARAMVHSIVPCRFWLARAVLLWCTVRVLNAKPSRRRRSSPPFKCVRVNSDLDEMSGDPRLGPYGLMPNDVGHDRTPVYGNGEGRF